MTWLSAVFFQNQIFLRRARQGAGVTHDREASWP